MHEWSGVKAITTDLIVGLNLRPQLYNRLPSWHVNLTWNSECVDLYIEVTIDPTTAMLEELLVQSELLTLCG